MIVYVVFFLSLVTVCYLLFGYPLLLAIIPWRAGKPIQKNFAYQPTVSVLMAVYNGADFIRAKLDSILAMEYPQHLLQILVVSDGSTDDTDAIVQSYADRGVGLVRVPHKGKSPALNQAISQATGDVLFLTDVRQPLDKMALRHLAANFADPSVGGVTGELHLFRPDGGEQADMDLYWRYEKWVRGIHSKIDSIFASTGCIYAIRRSFASQIPEDTLSDDAILPLRAFLKGYRVVFDPEARATDYPAANATEFRRRCRNLAGLWQVFVRLPQLFTWKNRMWFHFLSHKFGRLILPWALIVMAVSSLALPPSWFRTAMFGTELFVLLLAGLDWFIPKKAFFKRVSSPARTFLVMNAASLFSLRVFFLASPSRMWVPTRVDPADR